MTKLPESDFWKRLTTAWGARGLPITQLGVAKRLGMSQGSVQAWVRGQSLPTLETAIEIALRGKVCVEWLLTGRGPQFPDGARGDAWLDAVCNLLRDYPDKERPRLLEFIAWRAESVKEGVPQSIEEVLEQSKHPTGKHKKLS